jgi:hypothetical protein
MASDVNLAKYVNLLKSTDDEIPEDLYGKMVDRVKMDILTSMKILIMLY